MAVLPEDQKKTAFTTPWGMFIYARMPFGLINVGATFQRAMDIAFIGEQDQFVVVYLDYITMFSKDDVEPLNTCAELLISAEGMASPSTRRSIFLH